MPPAFDAVPINADDLSTPRCTGEGQPDVLDGAAALYVAKYHRGMGFLN